MNTGTGDCAVFARTTIGRPEQHNVTHVQGEAALKNCLHRVKGDGDTREHRSKKPQRIAGINYW